MEIDKILKSPSLGVFNRGNEAKRFFAYWVSMIGGR